MVLIDIEEHDCWAIEVIGFKLMSLDAQEVMRKFFDTINKSRQLLIEASNFNGSDEVHLLIFVVYL
jgi:hypothetical protein